MQFVESNRGGVNLAHCFYLRETRLGVGTWEVVYGGARPHVRTNDSVGGTEFEKWLSQLPTGWIRIFTLELEHLLVNLNQCSSAYTAGADSRKGFNHVFVPAHSINGGYRYEDDLTVRVNDDSLVPAIHSADLPAGKRVFMGAKTFELERA